MQAKVTNIIDGWVNGTIDKFNFQAKVYDEGSKYGINNGRVSKLAIWNEEIRQEKQNFLDACIVNYDRGWDIEPTEEYKPHLGAVMELLENRKI
jgi:hypothetical protein